MTAPVEAGQILAGKYRVEKVLGEGGMGVVVAAMDTTLERRVAIKFLLPQYAMHPEAATRFLREARAAVKIQSEHIARVIDVSSLENGAPYMVMEHLQGGDLSDVLRKNGPVSVDTAVAYVLQASDAIAEAHAYGIVHRDLKPANLFLANQPDGSVKIKVLDFGISKNTVASETKDVSLTRTSSMMGSPLYMSPEQMRSSRDVDTRTDIWALGVILYELLTGRLPFDATSIPELSAKILLDDPEPLSRADVPAELERAISRALAKSPSARFPTVAEFAVALAPFTSKRARANVERISKLLQSAGLSQAALTVAESLVPPPNTAVLANTVKENSPGDARRHTGTLSEWGKTNGPLVTHKKRGRALWALVLAAVALLGGGALFLWRTSEQAEPTALSESNTETSAQLPAGADMAPVEAKAPAQPTAAELRVGSETRSASAVGPAPGVAETSATETRLPVTAGPPPVAHRPRVPRKAPTTPPPASGGDKKPGSGSLKDQFGGRK
jgi:eukaryotic-like serine/threonine-protein kinase